MTYLLLISPTLQHYQASKQDSEQSSISSILAPLAASSTVDAVVVGCGPAGIYLAAQLAEKGLNVGLIGKLLYVISIIVIT